MNPSTTAKRRLAASALGIFLLVNAPAAPHPNDAKVDKLFTQRDRKDSPGAAIVVVKDGIHIVFVHPAEFLVTGPDGSILSRTLLEDRLLITPEQTGGEHDRNRVFYFDLPLVRRSVGHQ